MLADCGGWLWFLVWLFVLFDGCCGLYSVALVALLVWCFGEGCLSLDGCFGLHSFWSWFVVLGLVSAGVGTAFRF